MPQVRRHMSSNVLSLARTHTLEQAAKAMIDANVGSVLVVDGGAIVGIVTERDVMRVVGEGMDPREIPIEKCMTPDPVYVSPDTPTSKATEIMFQRGFRHLPVLQDDQLAGIVSSRDLLRAAQQEAVRQAAILAKEAERRRIEQDIHDGAQQKIVAIGMKVRAATRLMPQEDPQAVELIGELEHDVDQALDTLKDLVRGNYQALLDDLGLAAALDAHVRGIELPVEIEAGELERFDSDVETAVYFCCLEALQNITKHAGASRVRIRLEQSPGELRFSISDDGRGFDPEAIAPGLGQRNMTERVEALGGELQVRSAPASGTTVQGRVPLDLDAPS